jgi:hypothetical protein
MKNQTKELIVFPEQIELRDEDERALIGEIETTYMEFSVGTILDNVAHQRAVNERVALKIFTKRLEEVRKKYTQQIDAFKRRVLDYFGGPALKLQMCVEKVDRAILNYEVEVERIRRAEQQRIDENARKEEQKERLRLEAEALSAIKKGNDSEAERLIQKVDEVRVAAPVLPVNIPKASGAAFRQVWHFEITDASLLPRHFLKPDDSVIGAFVRSAKEKAVIPGVKIWAEKIVQGTR